MIVSTVRVRHSRPCPWFPLVLAPLVWGCEESDPPPSLLADGSGVEVVHTPGPTWSADEVWRLSSEPLLSIGVVEGAAVEEFSRITHAFWLSDGRVAAVNFANPPEIRLFAPDGGHQRTVGGAGGGPGEFAAITFAAPGAGDTLVVHDLFTARFVYLAPEGEVLRTQPMPWVAGEPSNRWIPVGLFRDGTLLAMENNLAPGATPGHRRAVRTLLRVTDGGTLVDTVLAFPDREYRAGETGFPALVPFGLRSAWHLHQDRLYLAPGDAFQVDVHDADGILLRSLRTDRERRPVAPEQARQEEERQTRGGAPATPSAQLLPAHGTGIRVGPDGHVWLEHVFAPGDRVRRWGVFAPDGIFLGDVEVPGNFQVMQVGRGQVLGVWTGELDVPGLRVYAVGPDA